jgi:hypothetical protein
MLKWLRNLFVGEKGVASTPESLTPVPSVSQERVDQINRETEKVLEEVKAENEKKAETAPKQEWKDWPKSEKPGIQKKTKPKPQSTTATKSKAVKARAKPKPKV